MIVKTCAWCGVPLNPNGEHVSHRKMYCCKEHGLAMAHWRQNVRRRGENPEDAECGNLQETITLTCPECGEEFQVQNVGAERCRVYCNPDCEKKSRSRRQLAAYYRRKEREQSGQAQHHIQLEDPWTTGQLPSSVRMNALWG